MATISENDLLIHFDPVKQMHVIDRLMFEHGRQVDKVLLAEVHLSQLKAVPFDDAARLLGKNILIFLSGTRQALIPS